MRGRGAKDLRRVAIRGGVAALMAGLAFSCGGGGGGSVAGAGGASSFTLLSFNRAGLGGAAINEMLRFVFNAPVQLASVNLTTLQIVDVTPGVAPVAVTGSFDLDPSDARVVRFHPSLPATLPAKPCLSVIQGAGLQISRTYRVTLPGKNDQAVVIRASDGTPLDATGTFTFRTGAACALKDFVPGGPRLVGIVASYRGCTGGTLDTLPRTVAPGAVVEPSLSANPVDFILTFDQALDPSPTNLTRTNFSLLVDPGTGTPVGFPVDVTLAAQSNTGATIKLRPMGMLPFQATVRFNLSGQIKDLGNEFFDVATNLPSFQFVVAAAPCDGAAPALVEDFSSSAQEDRTAQDLNQDGASCSQPNVDATEAALPFADWGIAHSTFPDVLRATTGFPGDGSMGLFDPPPGQYVLDTDATVFTNPTDGKVYPVTNGEFHFTDVFIRSGVTVTGTGSLPLQIFALGSVVIEGPQGSLGPGILDVSGADAAPTMTPSPCQKNDPVCDNDQPGGVGGPGGSMGGTGSILDTAPTVIGEDGFGTVAGVVNTPGAGGEGGFFSGYGPPQPSTNKGPVFVVGSGGGAGSHTRRGGSGEDGVMYVDFCGFGAQHPWGNNGPLGGGPGPLVWRDSDPNNNYIGPGGEYSLPVGGAGGGAGGDQYALTCSGFFSSNPPFQLDPAGGGGGGGGGAVRIATLERIKVEGQVLAKGGNGGDGLFYEPTNNNSHPKNFASTRTGAGGGGSGGMILFQAIDEIDVQNPATGTQPIFSCPDPSLPVFAAGIRADGGAGMSDPNAFGYLCFKPAVGGGSKQSVPCWHDCDDGSSTTTGNQQFFDDVTGREGGHGGDGLIQMQLPGGALGNPKLKLPQGVSPGDPLYPIKPDDIDFTDSDGGGTQDEVWPTLRLDLSTPFGPRAVAVSRFRFSTLGVSSGGPHYQFDGTDPTTGTVRTDAKGRIDPSVQDLKILEFSGDPRDPLAPVKKNRFPADSVVRIEFQGARELVPGSGILDLATMSCWTNDVSQLDGFTFLRFRVIADIVTTKALAWNSPLPAIDSLSIRFVP